jgi:S1-C subfamily serine protease
MTFFIITNLPSGCDRANELFAIYSISTGLMPGLAGIGDLNQSGSDVSWRESRMRFRRSSLFLLLIITAPAFAQLQWPRSPGEIARQYAQAVVIIEQLDQADQVIGQGSGFIVTSDGVVITNFHVIDGAARLRVKLQQGAEYLTTEVLGCDRDKDIAVIKVGGSNLPVVKLGDSDRTEVGEPIVAISSPAGLINTLSTGIISAKRSLGTHQLFQMTAPIGRGSSGGAVFDSSGAVIAISTYLFKDALNISFAVPINYALKLLANRGAASAARPSTPRSADGPINSLPAPGSRARYVSGKAGGNQ